ncbi:MAG: hypothetical protein IKO55_03530 [Kiritimatiellae bacterium]|nr:hypothetical protein [Kiritimatiellia bacterium]
MRKSGGKMGYPLNSVQDVQAVMLMCKSMGYACEWSGICVWIDKAAKISKARERELETMGARWAKKRGQWFFRACDGLPKTIETAA